MIGNKKFLVGTVHRAAMPVENLIVWMLIINICKMSKDKQDAIDNKQSYLLVEIEQGRIKVKGPQNFLNCLYNCLF